MAEEKEYNVSLEQFSGPLDLLLFLVSREEVDILAVPLARVADQYQAFLEALAEVDCDRAGEFLVLAATLMELKARQLVPLQPEDLAAEEDAGDPRLGLLRQLLQFRVFKEAALALERLAAAQGRQRPVFLPPAPAAAGAAAEAEGEEAGELLEDLDLFRIAASYQRVSEAVGLHLPVRILREDTPQEVHVARVRQALGEKGELPFLELAAGRSRLDLLGLFLAILEMARQREVAILQREPFGEIFLRRAAA